MESMHESHYYFTLVMFNDSAHCEQHDEPEIFLLRFYSIVGLLMGPVNAILNGICVHLFKHPAWRKSTMSQILKGLSIFELCMGLCLFLHSMLERISEPTSTAVSMRNQSPSASNDANNVSAQVSTITSFLLILFFSLCLLAFQVARNWSVVLLAAYRYDRICRPIGTATAFPKERIRIILISVIILSCLIVLPRSLEYGIVICRNSGLYTESFPLLNRNRVYQILYLGVLMFIVQSGGPVICVCVLSAYVIRIIAKRRQIRRLNERKSARHILGQQQSKRNEAVKQDIQRPSRNSLFEQSNNGHPILLNPTERPSPSGDKLIFAMCITFFVLETPAFFSKILNPYLENYKTVDICLSVIANLLIYLDSTLNAFVYMASNPTFRKIASEEFANYRTRMFGGAKGITEGTVQNTPVVSRSKD